MTTTTNQTKTALPTKTVEPPHVLAIPKLLGALRANTDQNSFMICQTKTALHTVIRRLYLRSQASPGSAGLPLAQRAIQSPRALLWVCSHSERLCPGNSRVRATDDLAVEDQKLLDHSTHAPRSAMRPGPAGSERRACAAVVASATSSTRGR